MSNDPDEPRDVEPIEYATVRDESPPTRGYNNWVRLGMVLSFIGVPVGIWAIFTPGWQSDALVYGILSLVAASILGVIVLPIVAKLRGRRTVGGSLVGGLFGGVVLWLLILLGLALLIYGVCFAG